MHLTGNEFQVLAIKSEKIFEYLMKVFYYGNFPIKLEEGGTIVGILAEKIYLDAMNHKIEKIVKIPINKEGS